MNAAPPNLAAKLMEELTRGGFLRGASATIDDRIVSSNTTCEASMPKDKVIAAMRLASPAFPAECTSLLERSLVLPEGASHWVLCLEFADAGKALAVGQHEDFVKGYDRG